MTVIAVSPIFEISQLFTEIFLLSVIRTAFELVPVICIFSNEMFEAPEILNKGVFIVVKIRSSPTAISDVG